MDANSEIQVVWQQAARGAWLNRNALNLETTRKELEETTERLARECAIRHRAHRAIILYGNCVQKQSISYLDVFLNNQHQNSIVHASC